MAISMRALSTIWLSAFFVPSIALQEHLARRQNPSSDWNHMSDAFNNDRLFSHLTCSSEGYNEYFKSLPAFSMSSLEIPANTRVLFFGTSYLHEVVENIVVANEATLKKTGPFGGFEGDKLSEDLSSDIPGYVVRWVFKTGSWITEVENNVLLQLPENIANLERFMEDNPFDIAFFMNPHPRCAFHNTTGTSDFCDCLYECYKTWDPNPCVYECDRNFEGYFRGERGDVASLWNVIYKAMKGNVYEVEAWTHEPRQQFHADEAHSIRTYPILAGKACNHEDDCSQSADLAGHQCQPGLTSFISSAVVAKMR